MLIDLTGQRFGKLVVERRSARREHCRTNQERTYHG